jgi:hypothetical protein
MVETEPRAVKKYFCDNQRTRRLTPSYPQIRLSTGFGRATLFGDGQNLMSKEVFKIKTLTIRKAASDHFHKWHAYFAKRFALYMVTLNRVALIVAATLIFDGNGWKTGPVNKDEINAFAIDLSERLTTQRWIATGLIGPHHLTQGDLGKQAVPGSAIDDQALKLLENTKFGSVHQGCRVPSNRITVVTGNGFFGSNQRV